MIIRTEMWHRMVVQQSIVSIINWHGKETLGAIRPRLRIAIDDQTVHSLAANMKMLTP